MKVGTLMLVIACLSVGCARSEARIALTNREPRLLAAEIVCSRSVEQAQGRALELERTALARWERAPFASEEAAKAAVELAEAESCFARAGDRAGKLRVQAKRSGYELEVSRRFARARLNLDLAVKRDQPERAKQEAEQMLALLSQSPDSDYRDSIVAAVRRLNAQIAERREP